MPDRHDREGPTEASLRKDWAEAFRVERARRRLSQVGVAAMAEVSHTAVHKAEDGRGSLDTFLAIARALEIDLFKAAAP